MNDDPRILQDRISVHHLEEQYQKLAVEMRTKGQGKTQQKERVHFCGLVCVNHSESYVFLPRNAQVKSSRSNQRIARTTMKVLAKYGQDSRDRTGISSAENGQTGLISTIQDLADDFLRYGIFSERVRYATKNSGKPNWPRTVARELAMISSNGNIVYPNIRTSRTLNAHDSILAHIQVAVLLEIAEYHGWWLEGLGRRQSELKAYASPHFPRVMWRQKLHAILPNLFAQRAIRLTYSLLSYLDRNPKQNDGLTLYGVEDFHSVWERMLSEVILGVENGWNSRLPKPAYRDKSSGRVHAQERGMRTDIVVRDGAALKVLDAKYYDATNPGNSPGWPDIVKQLFYHLALDSVTEDEVQPGSFVFPAVANGHGPYNEISVVDSEQAPIAAFPSVNCIYLSVAEVMEAYLGKRKIQINIP